MITGSGENILFVDVGARTGDFPGSLQSRTLFCQLHRTGASPSGVKVNGDEIQEARSLADVREGNAGYFYDAPDQRLYIQVNRPTDENTQILVQGFQITGISEQGRVQGEWSLEQNYPNPFNRQTEIQYTVSRTGRVVLTVYDLLGREVIRSEQGVRPPGRYRTNLDLEGMPSGIYFCRMQAGEYSKVIKMMLLQ
jgi:hypothetical protein